MAHGSVFELDPDESVVYTVRRTLIGLIPIIATGVLVFGGMLFAVFLITRFRTQIAKVIPPVNLLLLIAIGLAVLAGLLAVVLVVVYLNNQMLITNKRIISLVQNALFNRQVAQLSWENVEDVTVKQANILETLFNYGTLVVQTAGEMENFVFKLGKRPYPAAKVIRQLATANPGPGP